MSDEYTQTVRIMRPARVTTDERGRTVWDGPVEEAEFELVSTTMLKQLLKTADDEERRRLGAAASGKDGVLARNTGNQEFEIIDDDDLRAALASAEDAPDRVRAADFSTGERPLLERADGRDEELSLVSTQALRKILGSDGQPSLESGDDDAPPAGGGGFDPYNHS